MDKIIDDTENLRKRILKSAKTIANQEVKSEAEKWLINYYTLLSNYFKNDQKLTEAIDYLRVSSTNNRLVRSRWLSRLNIILKSIKTNRYTSSDIARNSKVVYKKILQNDILDRIKKNDNKIYVLGKELNSNWNLCNCWNSCGILMRIILERSLDGKDISIKNKNGLKNKINFCLSSGVFGKSVSEALKKLDNSTKIAGDIVAHDSNILVTRDDIELAIIPFRILLADIF